MSTEKMWLPEPLVHNGCEFETVERAYDVYYNDFVLHKPSFQGIMVIPFDGNKNLEDRETFTHLTTKKPSNASCERKLSITRCCRIPWIAPIIDHCQEKFARVFFERKGTKDRICIWYEKISFVIVLNTNRDCYRLVTAYTLSSEIKAGKLKNRYKSSRKHPYSI